MPKDLIPSSTVLPALPDWAESLWKRGAQKWRSGPICSQAPKGCSGSNCCKEVSGGASTDRDSDGVPDECQNLPDDLSLILNTGFDQIAKLLLPEGELPDGTDDDDWVFVNTETPRPAKVVIDPVAQWPDPLSDSLWISVDPDRGSSVPGLSKPILEHCFCLAPEARNPEIRLQLLADDRATVFLNDSLLAGPGGDFASGEPLTVIHQDNSKIQLFRPGINCLSVELDDSGGVVTGLNLIGTIPADNGVCQPLEAVLKKPSALK